MFFFDRTTRHHRLPAWYDELKLPSDYLFYERVSLLSDLAVMTPCGGAIECAFDGTHFYYHCTGAELAKGDHIAWYCGRHRLGFADDVDRAVWTQASRLLPKQRRLKTAYERRSLLLSTYALLKVSLDDRHYPVIEWITHQRLRDRSFHCDHDRDLARRLRDRRVDAATGRHHLPHTAISSDDPFQM